MIRKIIPAETASLRQKSKPVKKIDKKVKDLIEDMKETLIAQKDPEGIGLAAPQIGKNLRIFLMKPEKKIKVVVNPKIIKISKVRPKKKESDKPIPMEGCLSIPNFYGPLRRAKKLTLAYLDEKGNKKEEVFTGFEAQIVLHEIDHLEGVLFIDHILEKDLPLYELKNGEWIETDL